MKIVVDKIGNWRIEGMDEDRYLYPSIPLSALTILTESNLNIQRPFVIEIKKVEGKDKVKK